MVTIRKFRPSDAKACARVIVETFSQFNKNEGTKAAAQNYIEQYSPKLPQEVLLERFRTTPIFFVAVENGKVIGLARGRPNKITNLFLLGKHHGAGIGKRLMQRFEGEAKRQKSKFVKARASLYATTFYQGIGFKRTTGKRKFHGLTVQPMRKKL
ncbi:Acetyltransferase (GNAT) domain protein [uncultured archaeon]|nr:Acetyltransferase (GNAT) domain protein [uncultured archaeon]